MRAKYRMGVILGVVLISGAGFILGFVICYQRSFPYEQLRALNDRFKQATGRFPERPGPKDAVFLLGDSLVRRGDWRFIEPHYSPINLGMDGRRIRDVAAMVREHEELKDCKALLLAGINDIADRVSLEAFLADYDDLLSLCNARKIDLLVLAMPEVSGGGELDRRPVVRVFNEALRRKSLESGYDWLDLNSVWSDHDGIKTGYSSDLLHLTGKAYREAGPAIIQSLGSIDD